MADVTGERYAELRAQVSGSVCSPGTPGYDEAVTIWNAAIDRRPAVVVRASGPADVARAIAFARASGLELSVRGGGHNYAGFALCDGGLMIDLSLLRVVEVDPDARLVRCGGGTTWGDLDAAAQVHGLALPGGFISHTGVAGLTLGGGFGWLTRQFGLSCDNLVAAEVVTADGRILRASAEEHADLFWALRGGGGNFGVVTEFEFALHPVGPLVQLGLFLFDPADGRDLFDFARSYVLSLPDSCSPFLAGLSTPPAPFVPEELHFTPMYALAVVGFGDPSEHEAALRAVSAALTPRVTMSTPIPYVGLQQLFDESAPWGLYSYEKSVSLEELTDDAIDVILEHQARKMSPLSFVPIFVFGGAFGRSDDAATAFGGRRDVRYVVNISGTAPTPDGYELERQWVRGYWDALVPHATGVGSYVNFMTEPDDARVRSSYGTKYERLRAIKAAYDPDNVFHLNANITPS